MYLRGRVESAPSEELFTNPLYPYGKALISAALPIWPGEEREETLLSGEVPSPTNPPLVAAFIPVVRLLWRVGLRKRRYSANSLPATRLPAICINGR
ncbi:MAG: hypothetical protein ACRERE_09230 [Candidatus Entotheonellia bacterium]